jgi:hypothetical protein
LENGLSGSIGSQSKRLKRVSEMNISNAREFLSIFLLAGASYAWATDPAGTKCGDLLNMQIDNTTISEAIDRSVPIP